MTKRKGKEEFFNCVRLHRDDVIQVLNEHGYRKADAKKFVAGLDDSEMAWIASKIGDNMISQLFWESLWCRVEGMAELSAFKRRR